MELRNRVCVITGTASGIGRAGAIAFAGEGANVVCADLDEAGAAATAASILAGGGIATSVRCDVSKEADIVAAIAAAEASHGAVDLFWSNAGIVFEGGVEAPDAQWQKIWEVNTMAHVWAARALVPAWIERGGGYFVSTASAAGLLTNIGAASYAVTKSGAVALAEWLAMTHGDQGVKVSCLCPQGVNTAMLNGVALGNSAAGDSVRAAGAVLEPADVADVVVQAIRDERFLILPHPEVHGYVQRKATDVDRWLAGMRRLQAKVRAAG